MAASVPRIASEKSQLRRPDAIAQLAAQPPPAALARLGRRLVIAGSQHQQVASLVAVERAHVGVAQLIDCRVGGGLCAENLIDQTGHSQRENGIHVVPQLQVGQHAVSPATPSAEAVAKSIQKGIEVVVLDDEHPRERMGLIVLAQMPRDLQPQGRFAGPFLAEHDRSGRLGRIAVNLVPGRMMRAGDAEVLEDRIGLGVFLGERIGANAVVFEKLLCVHALNPGILEATSCNRARISKPSLANPAAQSPHGGRPRGGVECGPTSAASPRSCREMPSHCPSPCVRDHRT